MLILHLVDDVLKLNVVVVKLLIVSRSQLAVPLALYNRVAQFLIKATARRACLALVPFSYQVVSFPQTTKAQSLSRVRARPIPTRRVAT